MGVSALLDSTVEDALGSLQKLKNERVVADPTSLAVRGNRIISDLIARTRAGDYVWMSAILERFVRESVSALTVEVRGAATSWAEIRPSLFSLCIEFDKLREMRDYERIWTARLDLFKRLSSTMVLDVAQFAGSPLDGKSIRDHHFEIIWSVFGLPGPYLPDVRYKGQLRDLADGRNLVAHGETDALTFGRNKTDADLLKTIDVVETVILHMHLAMSEYMAKRLYRR